MKSDVPPAEPGGTRSSEHPTGQDEASEEQGIFVCGAGGQGKVVVSTLVAAGRRVEGLIDDNDERHGSQVLGHRVLGGFDVIPRRGRVHAVAAIGDNRTRAQVVARNPDIDWVSVVHPNADVHPSVQLGPGSVVFSGAVIQPDARLGAHCIVNTGATVDHDTRLGDFVHVAPGCHLAGAVQIEDGVFLGVGSSVSTGARVGSWTTVGAGAVVVRDLPSRVVAVGVPARAKGDSP